MEQLPDPTSVQSWPQAVVFIFLILAVLVVPSVLSYLGNRRMKRVETTLTTNNGGSTMKDAMDRMEHDLKSLSGSVEGLSGSVEGLSGQVGDLSGRVGALEEAKVSGLLGFLRRR